MAKPERRRRIPWQVWYLLSALGFGLVLLAQLGREWGWWNDWEVVLTVAGFLLAVLTAVTGASDRTVVELGERLEPIRDDIGTIKTVLERDLPAILRVLEERLPPRG
jgi:hypothetical protein